MSAQAVENVGCYTTLPGVHLCMLSRGHDGEHRCGGVDCDTTFTDDDESVSCPRCQQGGPSHKPCRLHGRVHCSSDAGCF